MSADTLKMAREALAELGAAHAWLAFGTCREFDELRESPKLLLDAAASEKARAAIAAIDAQAPPTVTGGSPEHLLQDKSRGLSQWLASKPDARMRVREACADIAAQAPQAAPVGAPVTRLPRNLLLQAAFAADADPDHWHDTSATEAAARAVESACAAAWGLKLADEPPEQAAPVALTDEQIDAIGNGLNGIQPPISRRERDRLIARAVLAAAGAAAPAPVVLTPLTEQQVFDSREFMHLNGSLLQLAMPQLMLLVRAIERAHGIGAAAQGGEHG